MNQSSTGDIRMGVSHSDMMIYLGRLSLKMYENIFLVE